MNFLSVLELKLTLFHKCNVKVKRYEGKCSYTISVMVENIFNPIYSFKFLEHISSSI